MAASSTVRAQHRSPPQVDKMATTTVGDAMHPGIVCCSQAASAAEMARVMASCRVHCVAVMGLSKDRHQDPVIWGIVSDLDLMQAAASPEAENTAAGLARQPVITIRPNKSIRDAAQAMVTYRAQHLVVVQPDRLTPVGVLSALDVARYLADTAS